MLFVYFNLFEYKKNFNHNPTPNALTMQTIELFSHVIEIFPST